MTVKVSESTPKVTHKPSWLAAAYQTLISYGTIRLHVNSTEQSIIPTVAGFSSGVQALLVFKRNQLWHGGQLRSEKINIHCVSVTLCEYLSQHEASRDQEPPNQYLLVLPSEELDFTIRPGRSPDSTSNMVSWLDMSWLCCGRLMKEITSDSDPITRNLSPRGDAQLRAAASRWRAYTSERHKHRHVAFTFYYRHGYIQKWIGCFRNPFFC